MRKPFLSIVIATLLAVSGASPVAAAARVATSIVVQSGVVYQPHANVTQRIDISGDLSQTVTIDTTLPTTVTAATPNGGSCTGSGGHFQCTGAATVILTFQAQIIFDPARHQQVFPTTATTPDGGYGSGDVRVIFETDLSVSSAYYVIPQPGWPYTVFNLSIFNAGPDAPPLGTVVTITGLDTSFDGVFALTPSCRRSGAQVVCDQLGGLAGWSYEFRVPVCAVLNPVDIRITSASFDPDTSNNTYHVAGETRTGLTSALDECLTQAGGGDPPSSGTGGSQPSSGTGGGSQPSSGAGAGSGGASSRPAGPTGGEGSGGGTTFGPGATDPDGLAPTPSGGAAPRATGGRGIGAAATGPGSTASGDESPTGPVAIWILLSGLVIVGTVGVGAWLLWRRRPEASGGMTE